MNKNFSVLKWIIFPILVLFFGIGISYVSIKIFGLSGSIPSILLIVICLAISLIFILHTSNHRVKSAMIAAFIFECLGITALGITLICSIIILRQFSGVFETVANQNAQELKVGEQKTEQLKLIAGLKSARAQNTATKSIVSDGEKKETKNVTLAEIYEKAEAFLLYPLIAEASVYLLGLLIVFGLVQFRGASEEIEENNIDQFPQTRTARKTFLASHAPLRVSSAHTVDNGAGFYLSLSPQGEGVSIRFRERGSTAKHVIRVPNSILQSEQLETMNYKQLALWTLRYMQSEGKDEREICKKIQDTL